MSGGGADEGGRTWSRHYRRPYTVTGGRTRPAHDDLELETLVQTVTGIDEQLAGLGREQRSIAALCREVVSVAEIAGRPITLKEVDAKWEEFDAAGGSWMVPPSGFSPPCGAAGCRDSDIFRLPAPPCFSCCISSWSSKSWMLSCSICP